MYTGVANEACQRQALASHAPTAVAAATQREARRRVGGVSRLPPPEPLTLEIRLVAEFNCDSRSICVLHGSGPVDFMVSEKFIVKNHQSRQFFKNDSTYLKVILFENIFCFFTSDLGY